MRISQSAPTDVFRMKFTRLCLEGGPSHGSLITCSKRGIVQSEEKLVISASWAKDDDISRLLKSLPNWINMAQPKQLRPKREDEEDFISFLGSSVSMLAYDGDSDSSHGTQGTHRKHISLLGRVRAAFGKESEVLIGNLGDKLIPPQDILRDVSDLKALANMHESLEWLAGRTKSAFSNLSTSQMLSPAQDGHTNMDLPPVSEQIMQTLSELARSFQDMADRCLLVLHLEVRVHCFHYLIPLAKEGNYAIVANVESMDYDPLVVKLNKDISAIEEAMSASLQQHKFQYIFEGLGHLISCILINGAQYFRRISESGIKKMCRNIFVLQQNLTNITMSREADLDFASCALVSVAAASLPHGAVSTITYKLLLLVERGWRLSRPHQGPSPGPLRHLPLVSICPESSTCSGPREEDGWATSCSLWSPLGHMRSTGEVRWVFESTGNVETDFERAVVKLHLEESLFAMNQDLEVKCKRTENARHFIFLFTLNLSPALRLITAAVPVGNSAALTLSGGPRCAPVSTLSGPRDPRPMLAWVSSFPAAGAGGKPAQVPAGGPREASLGPGCLRAARGGKPGSRVPEGNRQYYEMLYNTADELLNLVVDQGVKYTELEYIHALTLLHRSQTGVGDQTTQNTRLQRLKEIICEQAAIKQATKDKKITTV
ncbi:Exocyst complex component 4 [Myotis davidii]|uniref:Exocyst complex component Sec8 n=1 Tax=Myotis davidii TaxID=225400 RepID=L5MCV0_MYODS|nr:Exocyst complex component 4 [Myotis davidii]